ncbi:hypothetical protein C7212DRAFT_362357 [Tuber magnatum]|uniref:Uncharacterized protein n=1 Tax=Tuber magnatum TaxID=42249 RepID=A0A317SSM2_9PEZI|nr:hypothetical protein C7212DRAFT_362357 [Tuber magnatum]
MNFRRSRRSGWSSSRRRHGEPYWGDSHGERFPPASGYDEESDLVYWDDDPILFDNDDDDGFYSDSESDIHFSKEASRRKGKRSASMGSLQHTPRRREGSGDTEDGYEAEDEGSYSGRASHRRSFYDSDGYPLPPHLSHRSKRPSSPSGLSPRVPDEYSSYDSEGYPITHRTHHSDNHSPPGGHYQGSGHEPDAPMYPGLLGHTSAPGGSGGGGGRSELASHSSHYRSRTPRSRYYGREDLDEDSPPPPYSRRPSSGRPSDGSRARNEDRWLEDYEEDEEDEEDDLVEEEEVEEDGYILITIILDI